MIEQEAALRLGGGGRGTPRAGRPAGTVAASDSEVRNREESGDDSSPGYDVVVTSNVFGDILTDLGAMIAGGMGVAASGNLPPGQVSLFVPIHGSSADFPTRLQITEIPRIAVNGKLVPRWKLKDQFVLERIIEEAAAEQPK